MDRKELIMNNGYWDSKIELLLSHQQKNSKKTIRKEILKLKNELISLLSEGSQPNSEGANCAIFDVSLSLANQKAIEYAKLKHSDEYNDPAFERDISETELDFARGFVACREFLKANEG